MAKAERRPEAVNFLERLKQAGHRVTKVRKALIEILSIASGPLTVPELLLKLKEHSLGVNKTTVYRELEFLNNEGLLLEVDLLDRTKRYEVIGESDHHHHLVCTECNNIKCVEMHDDLTQLEQKISKKHKFLITSHVLEFFGVCHNCAHG